MILCLVLTTGLLRWLWGIQTSSLNASQQHVPFDLQVGPRTAVQKVLALTPGPAQGREQSKFLLACATAPLPRRE